MWCLSFYFVQSRRRLPDIVLCTVLYESRHSCFPHGNTPFLRCCNRCSVSGTSYGDTVPKSAYLYFYIRSAAFEIAMLPATPFLPIVPTARTNPALRQIQINLFLSSYHLTLRKCLQILCLYLCFLIFTHILVFCAV